MSSLPPNNNNDNNNDNERKRSPVDNSTPSPTKKANTNHHKCVACSVWHPHSAFSINQRKKGAAARRCKPCVARGQQQLNASSKKGDTKRKKSKCPDCGKRRNPSCYLQDDTTLCIRCHVRSAPLRCADCNILKTKPNNEGWSSFRGFFEVNRNGRESVEKFTPLTVAEFHAIVHRFRDVHCANCQRVRHDEAANHIIDESKLHRNRDKKCCSECEQWLRQPEYSETQWNIAETEEGMVPHRTCLSCSRDPKTTQILQWRYTGRQQVQQAREERAVDPASRKHGIAFYNSQVLWTTDEWVPPGNVVGEYDVVFHTTGDYFDRQGGVQEGEQRTTIGEAILMLDSDKMNRDDVTGPVLKGRVTFKKELWRGGCWRSDFTLGTGENTGLLAMDVDLAEHCENEVFIRRATSRLALPWIRHEELAKNDPKAGDTVGFDSLEQAETLARQYECGPDASNSWMSRPEFLGTDTLAKNVLEFLWIRQPKPIFFVEPEDLILLICWGNADDVDGPGYSQYILRRRHTIASINSEE